MRYQGSLQDGLKPLWWDLKKSRSPYRSNMDYWGYSKSYMEVSGDFNSLTHCAGSTAQPPNAWLQTISPSHIQVLFWIVITHCMGILDFVYAPPCAFLLCHTQAPLWSHFHSFSQGFCLIFVCILTGWALTAQEDILLASNSGIWTQTCQLPKSYAVPGLDLLKAYKIFWGFLCKSHMSICKLLSCPSRFDTA